MPPSMAIAAPDTATKEPETHDDHREVNGSAAEDHLSLDLPANDVAAAGDTPPNQSGLRQSQRYRRFRVPFLRKIEWPKVRSYCKKWIKRPMNIALLVWLVFVGACLVVIALLMTGLLNDAIPKDSVRKRWNEITNQILNALFTIMCIYQHPRLFHQLILLFSWKRDDILELRNVYCKGGKRRPCERFHMFLVVILLHLTCFFQYGLCALYWGFSEKARPGWVETFLMVGGTVVPIIAGLYTVYSPLGRKSRWDVEEEEEQEQMEGLEEDLEKNEKMIVVSEPEWSGGVFDVFDDSPVCLLSFFCTVCVFGWNMERLGFGNMYVHIVTFILFLVAPFWVFSVAAINISDDLVRYVMVGVGAGLCFLGLMYGGFWRSQMRTRFGLPKNRLCCGRPAITDLLQWLFFWWCSLAQEVRTASFYDIDDDSFCQKVQIVNGDVSENDGSEAELPELHIAEVAAETEMALMGSRSSSRSNRSSIGKAKSLTKSFSNEEELKNMTPPMLPVFQVEEDGWTRGSDRC